MELPSLLSEDLLLSGSSLRYLGLLFESFLLALHILDPLLLLEVRSPLSISPVHLRFTDFYSPCLCIELSLSLSLELHLFLLFGSVIPLGLFLSGCILSRLLP